MFSIIWSCLHQKLIKVFIVCILPQLQIVKKYAFIRSSAQDELDGEIDFQTMRYDMWCDLTYMSQLAIQSTQNNLLCIVNSPEFEGKNYHR